MRVSGFKRARAKTRKRVADLDTQTRQAIAETVEDVHRAGLENIDATVGKKTGRLRRFYKKSLRVKGAHGLIGYANAYGLVGYVNAKARRAAFYARFVHDGTARTKSRPFHDHAVLELEGKHAERMRAALRRALARKGGTTERNIE